MTSWIKDQEELQRLRDEAELWKAAARYSDAEVGRWKEAWKSRGRELNELYDVITEVAGDQGTRDPITDLRSLKEEADILLEAFIQQLGLNEELLTNLEAGRLFT